MVDETHTTPRVLTPYEKTQLARYGYSHLSMEEIGQKPIEYITGRVEFAGLVLTVTPDVLIPRVETEESVALALSLAPSSGAVSFADIGTGSGAIGIALAHRLAARHQEYHAVLSDISPAAVAVAEKNVYSILGTTAHCDCRVSDLLQNLPPLQFDLILANLPYIPSGRVTHLDSSVREFEPHLALDGGAEGLDLIRRFLSQTKPFLHQHSSVILEMDHTHRIRDIADAAPWLSLRHQRDSFGQPRFVIGTMTSSDSKTS